MCTLFSSHVAGRFPLLIAGNRDEFTNRAWTPVRHWPANGGVAFWAPRDELGGGTWLGINERGLIAAITNRLYREHEPDRPSRGSLCIEVLSSPDVHEARRRVRAAVGERTFNGFNLLVGHERELWWLSYGQGALREERLEPGAHVVTSQHDLDPTPLAQHTARFTEKVSAAAGNWDALATQVREILADPTPISPDYAICKTGTLYGTRSAALFGVDETGALRMYFAPDRPDRAPLALTPLRS